jgi:heme/copper-type cytochrome/quinol oxidase subunit 1
VGAWLKVLLLFLVCLALSAALAAPGRRYFVEAAVGCGISIGCTGDLTATLLLSVLGLISPFIIFAAGAFAVSRSLKAAEASKPRLVAVAFALLPPVLLLLFLFS